MPGMFSGELPAPFEWNGDKQAAVNYLCEHLAKGLWPLSVIRRQLVPPLPKQTLHDWRGRDADMANAIDDAFDRGKDLLAGSMILVAQGETGYSTGNYKRDRLVIATTGKLLSNWDKRYRERLVHENDPDNPMPAPTFVLQPVKSLQEIEKAPAARLEPEEGDQDDA